MVYITQKEKAMRNILLILCWINTDFKGFRFKDAGNLSSFSSLNGGWKVVNFR